MYPISDNVTQLLTFTTKQAQPIVPIAVSKQQSVENITLAYESGIHQFGENYVSEARPKISTCRARNLSITWHYIGRTRSQECKHIAADFTWVQTIDRKKIASKLSRHALMLNKNLQVCIQVNVSNDPNKSGVAPQLSVIETLASDIMQLSSLTLRGLMVIPHPDDKAAFARARQLFDSCKASTHRHFDTLSMGMSGDYQDAIKAGATMIRIGNLLFGKRQ